MTKVIHTKNNVPESKRKKRSWNKLFLFIGLLIILTITIGSYYYLTNKPKVEITILNSCEQETNELTILEDKIKTLQEELKKENLTTEAKTNLQQIINQLKEKETNLKNFVTVQLYMNHLEKEIQACEQELKENEAKKETSRNKKYNLEKKKFEKEEEFLALKKDQQKLFSTKEDLNNHVLKHLKEELKNPQLNPDKKTELEKKKTDIETRITNNNQEITKLITKIELKNKIATLTEEIETEKDETLKQLLKERKEICQKQLETLS